MALELDFGDDDDDDVEKIVPCAYANCYEDIDIADLSTSELKKVRIGRKFYCPTHFALIKEQKKKEKEERKAREKATPTNTEIKKENLAISSIKPEEIRKIIVEENNVVVKNYLKTIDEETQKRMDIAYIQTEELGQKFENKLNSTVNELKETVKKSEEATQKIMESIGTIEKEEINKDDIKEIYAKIGEIRDQTEAKENMTKDQLSRLIEQMNIFHETLKNFSTSEIQMVQDVKTHEYIGDAEAIKEQIFKSFLYFLYHPIFLANSRYGRSKKAIGWFYFRDTELYEKAKKYMIDRKEIALSSWKDAWKDLVGENLLEHYGEASQRRLIPSLKGLEQYKDYVVRVLDNFKSKYYKIESQKTIELREAYLEILLPRMNLKIEEFDKAFTFESLYAYRQEENKVKQVKEEMLKKQLQEEKEKKKAEKKKKSKKSKKSKK